MINKENLAEWNLELVCKAAASLSWSDTTTRRALRAIAKPCQRKVRRAVSLFQVKTCQRKLAVHADEAENMSRLYLIRFKK